MLKDKIDTLKKANQMRVKMKKVEKELSAVLVEGTSKNKLVNCVMNGKMEIQELSIDQKLIDTRDKKDLQKSVKQSVTDALKKAQKVSEQMSGDLKELFSKMKM